MTLSFEDLPRLINGRCGTFDVACPMCGPGRRKASNKVRKVLRVWNDGDGFVTYNCERCGEHGYAHDGNSVRLARAETKQTRQEQADRHDAHSTGQLRKALTILGREINGAQVGWG